MLKVITHITKAIIIVIVSVLCFSCGFDRKSINGDGNVNIQNRMVTTAFDTITVSGAIEVIVEQGAQQSVSVEADGNLQEHIKTEVKAGKLKIFTDVNISNAAQKKITVVLPAINCISAELGASVISKGVLKSDSFFLNSDIGGNLKTNILSKNLKCQTARGGFIEVVGTSNSVEANASSGSTLDAENLKVTSANANASTGGSVTVNPTAKLIANASGGGRVYYIKAPGHFEKKAMNGGDVSVKQ